MITKVIIKRKLIPGKEKEFLSLLRQLRLTAMDSAYRDGEPWRQELLQILRRNEQLVRDTVGKCEGLELDPVEATYLAWIDARGLDKRSPYAHFRNAGLGLSDGAAFGAPGYVRLNFACPLPMLQEGLSRMATS